MVTTIPASIDGACVNRGLTAWPRVAQSIASVGCFSIKVSREADLEWEPEPSISDQDSVRVHPLRREGP